MKLSFSVANGRSSSKSSLKPKVSLSDAADDDRESNQSSKHYVTEFDGSKTLAEFNRKRYVIPPKENEWRPYKKMKNLELPLEAAGKHNSLDFELEVPVAESDEKMSYGLNIRESGEKVDGVEKDSMGGVGGDEPVRGRAVENILFEKLKYDLHRLPEDRGFAEFDEVPVEGFGAALLAGYGWVEGRGIGKNAKEDVKVKEYTRRTAKEGLGFYDDKYADVRKEVKKEKVVEDRPKQDVVMGKENFVAGDEVRIVAGRRNVGLKGKVVEVLGWDKLVLKHSIIGEELEVRVSDAALVGSKEEVECVRKLTEQKTRPSKVEGKRVKELRVKEKRDDAIKSSGRKEERGSGYHRKDKKPQIKWLANHIKVRVISKDIKGGKLYCKKGEVVDILGPTTCDVSMDESRELVQGVDQELLETAIPRPGGPVLVLYGERKGVYGTLMDKNRERETGIVRDADTHSLITVGLEQIAEYVGDPDELGH